MFRSSVCVFKQACVSENAFVSERNQLFREHKMSPQMLFPQAEDIVLS